ncbi:hypothetical protein FF1_014926 [Malus domestica]
MEKLGKPLLSLQRGEWRVLDTTALWPRIEENWKSFMEQLSYMLTPQERTIFVSDRNKGLIESMATVFPHSHHAFCLEHLKRNVFGKYPIGCGKIFKDHIVHLFCKCAYAPTSEAFDMHLRVLRDEGGFVMRTFLDSLPKENWSNAFFEGVRYGEMWSNVAESFNSWIFEERPMLIYQLVNGIRVKMMERNSERNISMMVDLQRRFCSCYQCQIKGFPCEHAVAAIIKDDGNPYDYVEDFFTDEYCKSSYSFPIYPIPNIDRHDINGHEEIVVEPPLTKKQSGRPKLKRMKSIGE